MKRIFLLTAALLAAACTTDKELQEEPLKTGDLTVMLRLTMPEEFSDPTRALTFAQENHIDEIHVLLFDQNNTLLDIMQGQNAQGEGNQFYTPGDEYSGTGTFSITLPPGMGAQSRNLVVLANCNAILAATVGNDSSSTHIGDTYANVTALINQSITGAMYPSGGTMPMWGQTGQINITNNNSFQTIELMRAVARIDVGIGQMSYNKAQHTYFWDGKDTSGATIPFQLTSVTIMQPQNSYALIPAAANVSLNTATAPTLPTGTAKFSTTDSKTNFLYNAPSGFVSQAIYVPEANVVMDGSGEVGDANHLNRMCVIMGGYFNGNTSEVNYYRLDFAQSDGMLLNVLRNHCYYFSVAGVNGPGFTTIDDAFKSYTVNVTANVLAWNQANMGNIVFNGEHVLSVSKSSMQFYNGARTAASTSGNNTLTVYTDYPSGWSVSSIVDAADGSTPVSWLALSPASGAANTQVSAFVTTQANTTSSSRSAIIWVSAGNLRYPIQVTQRPDAAYVTPTIATYYLMDGSTYTINVKANSSWMIKSITQKGRNANVKLLNNKATDNLMVGTGSTGNASAGDNLTFTVANTPGNWGTIDVVFTSPDGRWADVTKTLIMAAKKITVAGFGLAASGEGGDKYNLITQNSSNTSNQQGFGNTTPNKMMITPANFGTTPTSTVICEGFNTNWYNMNGTSGANQTLTSAMIDWAVQMNPDLVWIGGNCQWGDDISLRLKQEFLDKGKTVICSVQEYATLKSMHRVVLGYTDGGNSTTSGWFYADPAAYNGSVATYQFADIADPILEGPFGNLRGKYWGTQYTGSYAFAVGGNSTNVIITYSNGTNKSGGGNTNINGYSDSWTTIFRVKNTNLIWICDDGFVRNDTPGDATVSPFVLNSTTFAPATKTYGSSPQQTISNATFVANAIAWVVARNPKS